MSSSNSLSDVEYLFFDVFGTVVDWKGSISTHLSQIGSGSDSAVGMSEWRDRAQHWRNGFFEYIKTLKEGERNDGGMDEVHRIVLDRLIHTWSDVHWDDETRDKAVKGWHTLNGWPDSSEGLKRLRKKFVLSTLTNGDTAVMIEMARFSDLPWDMHVCGDSIKSYKPDPAMYKQAIRLSGLEPGKCAMVAAHAYDLDAAKKCGMKTIYIKRSTEDTDQDLTPSNTKGRFDLFIDEQGLEGLAKKFGL